MELEFHRVVYQIPCLSCGASIPLHETTLEEITLNLAMSATDASSIAFLCPACKGIFVFDLETLPDIVRASAPAIPQTAPRLFFRALRCGNSNCEARRTLVAVRSPATTEEQFASELATANAEELRCPKGHWIAWNY